MTSHSDVGAHGELVLNCSQADLGLRVQIPCLPKHLDRHALVNSVGALSGSTLFATPPAV